MKPTIRPEKTRPLPFLFNELKRRHLHFDLPQYAFLLGEDVSVSSGFPSYNELLTYLRQFSFLRQHRNSYRVLSECDFRQGNRFPVQQVAHILNAFSLQYHSEYVIYCEQVESRILAEGVDYDVLSTLRRLSSEIKEEFSLDLLKRSVNDGVNRLQLLRGWFLEFSKSVDERLDFIKWIQYGLEPSGALLVFAYLMGEGLIHHVFTKGYDSLLEDALFLFSSVSPHVISEFDVSDHYHLFSSSPNIVKLHGDFYLSDLSSLDSSAALLRSNRTRIRRVLQEFGLVVVGYSGLDHSIMSVLSELKSENDLNFPLFWCSLGDEPLPVEVIDLINNTENTFHIPITSFDDLVHLLWQNFSGKLTTQSHRYAERESRLLNLLNQWSDQRMSDSQKIDFQSKVKAAQLFSSSLRLSDPVQQIVSLSQSVDLNPDDPITYVHRAMAYFKCGQLSYAKADFEKAVDLGPSEPEIFYQRARFYLQLDMLKKALEDINTAISLDSSNSDFYIVRAEISLKEQRYSSAVNDFDLAISLRPMSDLYLRLRGYAYYNSGHHEKALSDFNMAVSINEKDSANFDFRADFFAARQQYDLAISDYNRAIALNSTSSVLRNNRANCYKLMGELDKALEDVEKSLGLDEDNVFAQSTKAEVLALKGNLNGFYHHLESALKGGFPIWEHLDDDSYAQFKDDKRFQKLVQKYVPES